MSTPRTERARRSRLRRALKELDGAGLAGIKREGQQGRLDAWRLLSDDGWGSTYRVPGDSLPRAIPVPAAFFLRGWHLVLTPPEIAMLFAIMELSQQLGVAADASTLNTPGIALPQSIRYSRYGISGEVSIAAHQLHEFGIATWWDPMPRRRNGKVSPRKTTSSMTDGDAAAEDDHKPYQYFPRPLAPSTGTPSRW